MALAAEYSAEERSLLLDWARRSIHARFVGERLNLSAPAPHLAEKRGAFTTLHKNDELRGCIGFVEAMEPLWRAIFETARAAAFQDPRFEPLTEAELAEIKIEISVMSPLFPIAPGEVTPGVHGLLISRGRLRGLLLPQVAVEYGWDRDTFLAQTCRKAGLQMDAWREGATIEAFTAEVFGEE